MSAVEELLKRLMQLAALFLAMMALRAGADSVGLRLPWYLMHEVTLLLVPMVWLLKQTVPTLAGPRLLAFILTSCIFISMSAIAELLAIQHRYWAFFTDIDPLSRFDLGAIPVEEFLSYPMLLNLPVLVYVWLERVFPAAALVARPRRHLTWIAAGCGVAAVVLAAVAASGVTDVEPRSALPGLDAQGAVRFAAGPRQFGWTIVQLLGWAGLLSLAATARLAMARVGTMVALYFPFALFFELMACGRGWWVWNTQQTLGVTAWVLPVESFSMYITGALFPVIVFERLSAALEPLMVERPARLL